MDKKKLLKEHKHLKVSLINKIKFIYSKEFYKLSEEEQRQYMINKSSTEGDLATLSNLLYSDKASIDPINNLMLFWFIPNGFNYTLRPGETITLENPDSLTVAILDGHDYNIMYESGAGSYSYKNTGSTDIHVTIAANSNYKLLTYTVYAPFNSLIL